MTATGKRYEFKNSNALNYSVPDVYIDFASILGPTGKHDTPKGDSGKVYIAGTSDVDKDIPETGRRANNTLALVIANENYKNVAKVPSAFADGYTFSEYCKKILGVPAANMSFCKDASLAEIYDAMSDLQRKASVLGSDAEVIVYYAGHGLPDEKIERGLSACI